jgi:hypothetical protein
MAETKDEKKDLNALLQNAATGLWNYQKLRWKYPDIPAAQIKKVLEQQTYHQVHKKPIKDPRQMLPNGGRIGTYQLDVMMMDRSDAKINKGYNMILTLIDVNSRKVFGKAMKSTSESVDKLREMIEYSGKQ